MKLLRENEKQNGESKVLGLLLSKTRKLRRGEQSKNEEILTRSWESKKNGTRKNKIKLMNKKGKNKNNRERRRSSRKPWLRGPWSYCSRRGKQRHVENRSGSNKEEKRKYGCRNRCRWRWKSKEQPWCCSNAKQQRGRSSSNELSSSRHVKSRNNLSVLFIFSRSKHSRIRSIKKCSPRSSGVSNSRPQWTRRTRRNWLES